MKPKRKAAADIFKAQNVMLQEQQMFEEEKAEDIDDYIAAPQTERAVMNQMPMAASTGFGGMPAAPPPPPAQKPAPKPGGYRQQRRREEKKETQMDGLKSSEELQLEKEPIEVRETGFWIFRRVVVPPSAYVVHTRMGRKEPVTLGLGISFRYNPYTDAYLVVPAAMQTIGVVANCITKEKQGINILAYVQWQIDDFSVAYRKLDLSDKRDPLGIVNAQLREQAEAAVKDKIATMSVEEVLTDKAPVIAELTTRLRAVAEGRGQDKVAGSKDIGQGLGIKVVTVQIREALVSSQRLWQDLQAPFRNEQAKAARISHLQTQDEIKQKELETRQATETREAETKVAIERIKQSKETEAVEIRLTQEATRFTKQQENIQKKVELEEKTTVTQRESAQRLENKQKTLQIEQDLHNLEEESRIAAKRLEAELKRLEREKALQTEQAALKLLGQEQADLLENKILEAQLTRKKEEESLKLELEQAVNQAKLAVREKKVEIARLQREVDNLINRRDLVKHFIEALPDIAAQMPEPQELRVLQTSNNDPTFDALATFITKMFALAENLGVPIKKDK